MGWTYESELDRKCPVFAGIPSPGAVEGRTWKLSVDPDPSDGFDRFEVGTKP